MATALEVQHAAFLKRYQRRLAYQTRHDALREIARHLAASRFGLVATNRQIRAGAKTLFAMAKERG